MYVRLYYPSCKHGYDQLLTNNYVGLVNITNVHVGYVNITIFQEKLLYNKLLTNHPFKYNKQAHPQLFVAILLINVPTAI